MKVLVSLAAAALTMLGSVPAVAQGGYYTAKPTAAPSKASIITRSTLWKCADGLCSAKKSTDRDAIMCELVVQRVGTLESFTANGAAFGNEALAKCNARAS